MDRVCKSWFLAAVVVYWCFCLAVESSHVIHPKLQGSSPKFPDNKLRPRYHFRPPRNWINDPNGPMYYKGVYHLFYQYNPYGSVWGNIVWAHSVSTDLINWKALNPAIYPSIPSDIYGCWSGSATILPGDGPVILYTGQISADKHQAQNVAYPANLSDPYLREWIKPDYNPIMTAEKDGLNSSSFRDPATAWYHPNKHHWVTVVGGKRDEDNRGMAHVYRSKDFAHWIKAKHPLHSVRNSGMWECVDFYPVARGTEGLDTSASGPGVTHVLKASLDLRRFDYYTMGLYHPSIDKYVPFEKSSVDNSTGLRYDYGNFYASKTFYDPSKRRRILWGWANESDTAGDDTKKGWAGVQLIPRRIWLHEDGRQLQQWPVEEFDELRRDQVTVERKTIPPGDYFEVRRIDAAQADVEIAFEIPNLEKAEEFDPAHAGDAQALCAKNTADVTGGVGPFGLYVLASADLEERTAVFFKIFKNGRSHVVLKCHDPTHSTKSKHIYKPTYAGFVDIDLEKTNQILLRTLTDHSVVESFGEKGKTCISSRVYPTRAVGDDAHLFVFNNGAEDVKVLKMGAWTIATPEMNEEVIY